MTILTTAPLLEVDEAGTLLDGRRLFRGDADALLTEIGRLVRAGGRHLVVTPNVDHVLTLRRSETATRALDEAALRIADGAPLVGLARALGDRALRRLTGADLLDQVVGRAEAAGWRVAVVGGADDVARAAVARFAERHPGLHVRAVPVPFVDSVADALCRGAVDDLVTFRPDVVFLCLGAPKQEAWYLEWRDRLPDGVYVGAGAAVDFAAGVRVRAPRLVQRLGGEWLWRLAQEPGRLAHRYLVRGPGFLLVAARSLAHASRHRRRTA